MNTLTRQELKELADKMLYVATEIDTFTPAKEKKAYNRGVMDLADEIARRLDKHTQ